MSKFIFESYEIEKSTAYFRYSFEGGLSFEEKVNFAAGRDYDTEILDKALFLSFILIGTSYYKSFPSKEVEVKGYKIDSWQANFFNKVYQEGLSQFAYENELTRDNLAHFTFTEDDSNELLDSYKGHGILALQSGGKDSLLTASLLNEKQKVFTPFYITSSNTYPKVLDELGSPLVNVLRKIDHQKLDEASDTGGLNGHVPVTYIVQSLGLVQAILLGLETVLVSIAHEGEEPHGWIGDLPVNHQWSKTWEAEKLFSEYVHRYISPSIAVGSPLRQFSELKVAELFVQKSWALFGGKFSSCNIANYKQGIENADLKWCGDCPKCANAYLLFSPFLESDKMKSIFSGQDLFEKQSLQQTFKGLLGIDNLMKPFECIGEIDELRLAYHMAQEKGGYGKLSFEVPTSNFDYQKEYPSQK